MKRIVLIILASIVAATLSVAQTPIGWPEVIGLLAKARTQATTCVQVLKSNGDKASIGRAQLTYGMAEGEMEGVIAGLTIALVEGGEPSSLPTAQVSLEFAGKGQGDLRRSGQNDYPEYEGRMGRARKGRGRAPDQGDLRRRQRALDAEGRKRQARNRNQEVAVGVREMAQVQRHRRAIAAVLLGFALTCAPARAQDQGRRTGRTSTTVRCSPSILACIRAIRAQAVDASEHYAVTGGSDRSVRVWSVTDGSWLKTIWIPVGPNPVGIVTAVAISGDGSTIAVGGITETLSGEHPIYVFDRERALSFAGFGTTSLVLWPILNFPRMVVSSPPRWLAAKVASEFSIAPMIGTKPSEMTCMKVTGFLSRVTDVSRQGPLMPKYGFTNTTPRLFGRPFTQWAIRSKLQAELVLTGLLLAQMGVGSLLALGTGLPSMF